MFKLKMFINGEWMDSLNGQKSHIINPANGTIIAEAPSGNEEDAKMAIDAARRAFDSGIWSELSAFERASYLYKIADKIEENASELSKLETENTGKPLKESEFDIADTVGCFRYYAGLVTKPSGQTYHVSDPVQAMVIREPVGVCGLIAPWNFPLLTGAWKIAPALAAGNTIVFKPAEITPVTTYRLFEIIKEVGIPDGVANLVLGGGATVGNEIAESDKVDMVSFTGSTATGRSIMNSATGNIKNISLELGGKSPNIIFADADFETAVDYALNGIFTNAGQVCNAGSRLLLEESIHDKFIARLIERANKIQVGPGDDTSTEMGPLVSEGHMNQVLEYIQIGLNEGAKLACGGNRITSNGLEKGYYVEPTIFVNTKPDMRIVQEEIFGPVLVVQKFKDEAEAIQLANDTPYGLAAGVFSQDGAKALRVIKKVRAGITWVNAYNLAYNEAPWGGYKQSGIGRGLGTFGLDTFTEVKQININLDVKPTEWFSN
ncbi:aldehyde dehydrogenase family protein [Cytobacillus oceanisediminis]|uniref:aldehyde dehydrogenase family protein n=1 Tax=Cytobacillus oceanisediminis TaxID=665099 RepID=UPI0023DA5893|nr:aldehyde dehydrogenase family protein [Cytobacillus oceanisediminis]MDF2039239.1 aldehyde dehydrogenase family protein [Cytobacillus oceanisediminis]